MSPFMAVSTKNSVQNFVFSLKTHETQIANAFPSTFTSDSAIFTGGVESWHWYQQYHWYLGRRQVEADESVATSQSEHAFSPEETISSVVVVSQMDSLVIALPLVHHINQAPFSFPTVCANSSICETSSVAAQTATEFWAPCLHIPSLICMYDVYWCITAHHSYVHGWKVEKEIFI